MAVNRCIMAAALVVAACLAGAPAFAQKAGNDSIRGVVTGPNGPEAGVWVIAETADLPTKYAKVVVTDDKGSYVIPQLPKAKYSVWLRGYGLKDSGKTEATPGKTVNIKAVAATPQEDAEHYPGMYWYSLLNIPGTDQFPGTGDKGNGISPNIKTQEAWVDTVKNSCQSCHALGSHGIRVVPDEFKKEGDGFKQWARRTQSGQAMSNMALSLGYMGVDAALRNFADWTDRIAAGELPFAKPERPKGIERNFVVTMWNFSTPKFYLHDGISTYQHDPHVNANGPIYGAPEESTDNIPVLDPVQNRAYTIRHPVQAGTPNSKDLPMQPSAYWGSEPIWDGGSSVHNSMMDAQGRLYFSARFRGPNNPDFCKKGSDHPSAKVMPLDQNGRQLSIWDPKQQKWYDVDTCFFAHHLYFAKDEDQTLWLSQGGPGSSNGVVGWVKMKTFFATGDSAKSQGWTPIVVDTNGNGKRDAYVEPNEPLDPAKDKRILGAFYGIMPSPVDDTVWGQTMGIGFGRIDQPGFVVHIIPGANLSETALAELFVPPDGAWSPRGIDMTTDGVVWTPLASGHFASFDRRKCTRPQNGPEALSGKLCPEGWTLIRMPGPQFRSLPESGSANHSYYVWVDRYNTLGLGKNVPIFTTNGAESLTAVVDGKVVEMRVPYPAGFFTKLLDARVDDPKAGWKGKGVWTMSGTRTVFHNEGGTANSPKVYHIQLRPNPLAE